MKRLGLLLLFSLVLNVVAVADPIIVTGTATVNNDNDQHIYMALGSGPVLTYANHADGLIIPRDCAVGVPCLFDQVFTDAAGPIPGTEEVVLAQLYFTMITEPEPGPDASTTTEVSMVGIFTGTLQFGTCVVTDVAVCGEGAASLRYAAVDQNCGPNQDAACVYNLVGIAAGNTWNTAGYETPYPVPSSYTFAGTANWVPEPSGLAMLGTGLAGLFLAPFRRKLLR